MAFEGSRSFTVAGAPLARNTALVGGLQAEMALSRYSALVLGYNGEHGSSDQSACVMGFLSTQSSQRTAPCRCKLAGVLNGVDR